jgi:hypothetical protein
LYDFQNKQPLKTSIEKYARSNVRFKIKQLNYKGNGKDVMMEMALKDNTLYIFWRYVGI